MERNGSRETGVRQQARKRELAAKTADLEALLATMSAPRDDGPTASVPNAGPAPVAPADAPGQEHRLAHARAAEAAPADDSDGAAEGEGELPPATLAPATPPAPPVAPAAPAAPPAPPGGGGGGPPAGTQATAKDIDKKTKDQAALLAETNDAYLRKVGQVTLTLLVLAALVTLSAVSRTSRTAHGKTVNGSWAIWRNLGDWHRWGAPRQSLFVTTLVVTLALLGLSLLRAKSGGIRAMLIGKDGRFSTSATQVGLWTIALVFSTLFLTLQQQFGHVDASKAFHELDVPYLILLGGPFAAAGLARATMNRKTDDGTVQKTQALETKLSDVISNDDGKADLFDTQFILFNLVVLVYFVVAFNKHPTVLPALPDGLVGLTSVAALAYTAPKFAAANAPSLTSITKMVGDGPVRPGDEVILRGTNLIPSGATEVSQLFSVRARFGSHEVPAFPIPAKGTARPTELKATVPFDVAAGICPVTVVTAAGAESNPYSLTVVADTPVLRGAAPLPLAPGAEVTLIGMSFTRVAQPAGQATVWFGDTPQTAIATTDEEIRVQVPADLTGDTVAVKVWAYTAVEPSAATVLPVRKP